MKQFSILLLTVFCSCKIQYVTKFRIKDLETGKYYYINSYKQKDSCISFTEYNRNNSIRVSKTICKYEIRN